MVCVNAMRSGDDVESDEDCDKGFEKVNAWMSRSCWQERC